MTTATIESQLVAIEEREKPTISALEFAARQMQVTDAASAEQCGQFLAKCKERRKAIEEEFKPICDAANRAHKEAVAFRDRVLATVLPADKIAREKLATWQREQERLAKIEADRLAAIERERLEAERAERMRLAEIERAELVRVENERRAAAEKARQEAIEAAKAAKDKQALAAAKAIVVPPVAQIAPIEVEAPVGSVYVAPAPPPKVAGFSRRTTWKAEVVDAAKLPREYLIPNQAALDGLAKATKGSVAIPGVRFYEVETTSVR